jgi:two-component system, LuxR family, response regulator FixJ
MPTIYITEAGTLHRCALTIREREVLSLMHEGYNQKEIAFIINASEETVHKHLINSCKKLGARNSNEAVRLAGFN